MNVTSADAQSLPLSEEATSQDPPFLPQTVIISTAPLVASSEPVNTSNVGGQGEHSLHDPSLMLNTPVSDSGDSNSLLPQGPTQDSHLVPVPSIEQKPADVLEQSVTKKEMEALRQKVETLTEKVERLVEAQTAQSTPAENVVATDIPRPSTLSLAAAVDQARIKEAAQISEDQKTLEALLLELNLWQDYTSTLQAGILTCITKADQALVDASEAVKVIPITELQGRQQALELIGKMVRRLPEKSSSLESVIQGVPTLSASSDEEWQMVAEIGTPEKSVEAKLRTLEKERYQKIMRVRDLLDSQRKRMLSFVEKQILPVLDSLDEGERLSLPLVKRVTDTEDIQPVIKENMQRWFVTYKLLREDLLVTLKKIRVEPMAVELGQIINYTNHEPFDVVPDPCLPTEAIKEVSRKGYVWLLPDDQTMTVLRAAQVVVVKN